MWWYCMWCPYLCSSCFIYASVKEKIEIKNMKTNYLGNFTDDAQLCVKLGPAHSNCPQKSTGLSELPPPPSHHPCLTEARWSPPSRDVNVSLFFRTNASLFYSTPPKMVRFVFLRRKFGQEKNKSFFLLILSKLIFFITFAFVFI